MRMIGKNKKILVTGSSGFIGTNLVNHLLTAGLEVTGIDIIKPQYVIEDEHFQFYNYDLASKFPTIEENIDIVFHLAAYANPNLCKKNPDIAFRNNVQVTYNVLQLANKKNVENVIFTSSAQLYGNYPKYFPINESHPTYVTDNVYSITKKLCEDICNTFIQNEGLNVNIVRLFNIFGPFQSFDYLIPTIIKQAIEKNLIELWSKKPIKDFLYIDDLIEALICISGSKKSDLYNIGSGDEFKIKDIAEFIASKFNSDVKFLDRDVSGPLHLQCDNSKLKREFNWVPNISVFEGIKNTIDWNVQHIKKKLFMKNKIVSYTSFNV